MTPTTSAPGPGREGAIRRWALIRSASALGALLVLAAAWKWTPLQEMLDPARVSEWLGPHRSAWYAFPATVLAFVVLGFAMVPALGMVAICGLAFGPMRGAVYALAGALASAAAGFTAGRRLGKERLQRVLGRKAGALSARIAGDGALAVYLIRKVPAPFTLVNLLIGASGIRFLEFLAGTLLGMGPIVVVLSVSSGRVPELLEDPAPRSLLLVGALLLIPIPIAFAVDAAFKRRRRERNPC